MFDFGNKKEIESLKEIIAKLTLENMEKDKTVDYLIREVNKLDNRVKELKNQLEKETKEKEEWHNKWDEAREYDCCVVRANFKKKDDGTGYFEIEDVEYVEMNKKIKKFNFDIAYENKKYNVSSFLYNDEILNEYYIKKMIKNKKIPMYNGIPFRKLQDLYRVMRYLESERNIDYKKEVNYIDFTNKIKFKDKMIYFNDKKIKDSSISYTIEPKDKVINFFGVNVKLYRNRNILIFNNKEFKSVRELMKLIKEECYKNKELLKQFL